MQRSDIVIGLSKGKIILLTLGSIGFVALGFWLLDIAYSQTRYNEVFVVIIAIASIAFFGMCGIGKVVKFEGVSSMDKPIINDQIELLYNADNPQEAVEEDGAASKGGIYLGIVLLILALLDLFSIINLTYESGTPKQ